MGSKSKKVVSRKPSFKTAASKQRSPQPRKWEMYTASQPPERPTSAQIPSAHIPPGHIPQGHIPQGHIPSAQSRLVMGYYSSSGSNNYCCDDCSLPSSENEYWPPPRNFRASELPNVPTSHRKLVQQPQKSRRQIQPSSRSATRTTTRSSRRWISDQNKNPNYLAYYTY